MLGEAMWYKVMLGYGVSHFLRDGEFLTASEFSFDAFPKVNHCCEGVFASRKISLPFLPSLCFIVQRPLSLHLIDFICFHFTVSITLLQDPLCLRISLFSESYMSLLFLTFLFLEQVNKTFLHAAMRRYLECNSAKAVYNSPNVVADIDSMWQSLRRENARATYRHVPRRTKEIPRYTHSILCEK